MTSRTRLLASEDTARRLLDAAIEVFGERGYHKASTREICRRAGVNSAAIHYHFGDKAALYRAVFRVGFDEDAAVTEAFLAGRPRREALALFYEALLAPLAGSALHQRLIRMRAREEFEPSGVLGDAFSDAIGPRHRRFIAFLTRELGLRRSDLEVERLAFALVGMGITFYHVRDLVHAVAPRLLGPPAAVRDLAQRLAGYADALITEEAARRHASTARRASA